MTTPNLSFATLVLVAPETLVGLANTTGAGSLPPDAETFETDSIKAMGEEAAAFRDLVQGRHVNGTRPSWARHYRPRQIPRILDHIDDTFDVLTYHQFRLRDVIQKHQMRAERLSRTRDIRRLDRGAARKFDRVSTRNLRRSLAQEREKLKALRSQWEGVANAIQDLYLLAGLIQSDRTASLRPTRSRLLSNETLALLAQRQRRTVGPLWDELKAL